MNIRHITWQEFDDAVASYGKPVCDGFYPIPRGGLVLAVALSHRFGKPVLERPTNKCILVDDIADSGNTLNKVRLRYPYPAIVLAKRSTCRQSAVDFALLIENDDWLVFPWENKEKAQEDYEAYLSRK